MSGEKVAEHIQPHDGGELEEKQIQPNGVDLTIDEILQHNGRIYMGDEEYRKSARADASKSSLDIMPDDIADDIDSRWVYHLEPGGYTVVYDEEIIEIPENHVGFVWPRSRFLRVAAHLTSAVWDTGYSGRGEGALITTQRMYVQPDMRIGQMVFARASHHTSYEGQHQQERLEEDDA